MNRVDRSQVRPSEIAGTWYPGRAQELRATVERYLANVAPSDPDGEVVGLIVPHAGYVYSGQVAAYAYRQVEGQQVDVVALVSPVHRVYVGPYMVTSYGYYETPLGLVPVATELVDRLGDHLQMAKVRRDGEHALEIQLPFLQCGLGEFRLLPVMLGDQDWDSCERLGLALASVLEGRRALLVASTDLSHFHSSREAEQLDRRVLDRVAAFDPLGLSQDLARGGSEACGGGVVVAVMLAARRLGAGQARVLRYAHSGDVTGDGSQVVGYLAAALLRPGPPPDAARGSSHGEG